MYRILIITFVMLLSGCTNLNFKMAWGRPASLTMEPPPGPPIYQQGFKDGCESGYSGYANNFNKLFYTWKQDPQLSKDPVYYKIWKDGYWYCAAYAMMVGSHGHGNWR